jgi:hypothetical protein
LPNKSQDAEEAVALLLGFQAQGRATFWPRLML